MSAGLGENIRRLFRTGTVAGLGEDTLLDRFLENGDESAFEALVVRHGPMVLGVCGRLLKDSNDVEDAFQATFLILARKAGTLRRRDSLAPWLYGVAYKVAARARIQGANRPDGVGLAELADSQGVSPAAVLERDEAVRALHEAVARLPETYRAPIVLCYLEGLTHEEAAGRLRWPVGTVRGRLARARETLRERLARQGFNPASLVVLGPTLRLAPSHLTLVAGTVRSAVAFAAGRSLPAVAHPAAGVLAQGVLHAMAWNTTKASAAVVTAFALGSGVVWWADHGAGSKGAAAVKPGAEKPAAEVDKSLVNWPEGTFPDLVEVDTTEAARKAQTEYDSELTRLTEGVTDVRAGIELLNAQADALKKELSQLAGGTLPWRFARTNSSSDFEKDPKQHVEFVEKSTHLVTSELAMVLKKIEAERLRGEEAGRRLDDQKRRPRPVERIVLAPGDKVIVEVLEALPGRPISGEREVRADGRISLGFYGEVHVTGLSLSEVKEKVVLRLRRFLNDDTLGLVEVTAEGKTQLVQPKETNRVFVDLVSQVIRGDR